MVLRSTHTTRYLYRDVVSICHSEAHLRPRGRAEQKLVRHRLQIDPLPDFSLHREDYFGNSVTMFSIEQPHRELTVTAESLVSLAPGDPPHLELSPPWESVRDEIARRATDESFEAAQFVFRSPLIHPDSALAEYASTSFAAGRPFLEGVDELSHRIYTEFHYDQRATTVTTPVDEVLASRRGVCQDFAQLMIGCLRSLGLPARYVSGYVRSGKEIVGSGASHAWVSVYCPVFGWQDFDPTNNVQPHGEHITLAWGRDYSDVTPVKGVALGGGEQVISVSVEVGPPEDSTALS